MATILFGSSVRRQSTKESDIDVLVISNDVSFQITDALIESYRIIVEKIIVNTSPKLHITSMTYTSFWEYVKAGKKVDELAPVDARVIAPAMGDTIFLFQTKRVGWPIGFDIQNKINLGATIYVTTSMDDEAKELELEYKTIEKTKDYLMLDLTTTLWKF